MYESEKLIWIAKKTFERPFVFRAEFNHCFIIWMTLDLYITSRAVGKCGFLNDRRCLNAASVIIWVVLDLYITSSCRQVFSCLQISVQVTVSCHSPLLEHLVLSAYSVSHIRRKISLTFRASYCAFKLSSECSLFRTISFRTLSYAWLEPTFPG